MFEDFVKAGKEVLDERSFKKMLEKEESLSALIHKAENAPDGQFDAVIVEIQQFIEKKGITATKEEVQALVEEEIGESFPDEE